MEGRGSAHKQESASEKANDIISPKILFLGKEVRESARTPTRVATVLQDLSAPMVTREFDTVRQDLSAARGWKIPNPLSNDSAFRKCRNGESWRVSETTDY